MSRIRSILISLVAVIAIVIMGCTGGSGTKHVPQASDSLYTEERAMEIYAKEPQRALRIIDSAEVVGNVSDFRAELLRARIYAYPHEAMNLDTARQMGVALLEHDSVKSSVDNRMEVLRLLTGVARIHLDYPDQVKWAAQLATLCREQGDERPRVGGLSPGMTEALRTESEIGIVLTHLGQRNEGFQMLDKVIGQLDGQRHFQELDACIIAMKRKLTAMSLLPAMTMSGDSLTVEQRQQEIIKLAERFIAKLDDYEQHPNDYADGSDRQPDTDEVPGYCGFYRSQAYVFLAQAYAQLETHPQPLPVGRGEDSPNSELSAIQDTSEKKMGLQGINTPPSQGKATGRRDSGNGAGVGGESSYIRSVIIRERLYLNPQFDRQAAIDYFHLSKERIGAAFAQGSEFPTIADFINRCRLEYARELFITSPEMTIDDIASASGFGTRRTFSRLFKERYSITPTEYRNQNV